MVALDAVSRYLRVQAMERKYATNCIEAFKKMIKSKQPEKVWTDKGTKFEGALKKYAVKKAFIYIQLKAKPSQHLLRGILDHSKTSFTNILRKTGRGLFLMNFRSL